ncbi:MAG TPA: phosphoribosylamine--glycine ligase [Ignavibacteriaceae bacterium]|nr:phosphoribosylamine--glycine ligase [Ignavibacteriaceae bacterium]
MIKVLLIGSGGREHALALKISESKSLSILYCAPGNPGTEKIAHNINLDISDHQSIVNFSINNKINLVIIGPEQPLVEGLSDKLRQKGIKVFGPSSNAAKIESSKAFAKNIMLNANVVTADYHEFDLSDYDLAKDFLDKIKYPIVIKADGLAAGKGVLICENILEADQALKLIFEEKIFGDSGNKIIVEEFLEGEEASVFAITDGEDFICLPAAQDHKRIGDGDTGKNTGGMGAYAPAPLVDDTLMKKIANDIIQPVLKQMKESGNQFIGCLYAGLMIHNGVPKVIEFNCRFGDPETQVVLPILEGDFLDLLYSAACNNLNKTAVKYSGGCAVCVVAASNGYPDHYKKGFEISGLDQKDNEIIIYHAGTKKIDNKIVTNGGRVLGVTTFFNQNDLSLAKQKAYNAINKIYFDGIYYRKDIADKGIRYIKK